MIDHPADKATGEFIITRIGTETFWQGIRQYYRTHMNRLASSDDLRRVMEHVSGQELSWFFRQWLNRSGVPVVEGDWHYDAAARQVVVTILQAQAGEPYRLTVGVGVSATAGAMPLVEQAEVTARESTITIASATEPASVVLDPNVSLLADFGTFRKTAPGR